jgi:mannose-6-phosphate isomerase-like protein (cupin superfamily)
LPGRSVGSRLICEVDDAYIKVAKVHGSLTWHSHENEDELFLILKGHLRIEMQDGAVELGEGDMFVVPKGVRHNPVADEECHIMLIERKTTLHTGDVVTEKTRSLAEQLRPL